MSDDKSTPESFFRTDHRDCDDIWAELEAAVDGGHSDRAPGLWQRFDSRMRRHFAMEEEVLFPALEAAAGFPPDAGPTAMMRSEHLQMRGMLDQMAAAANNDDLEAVLDHGDTLMMLIQQHNTKEEGILYRMADEVLLAGWAELTAKLEAYPAS